MPKWQATITYDELDQLLLGQMGAIVVSDDLDTIFGHLSEVWEDEMRDDNSRLTVTIKSPADPPPQ